MGTIADKLSYLAETKSHFVDGMKALEYPIADGTTFREMADMLYEEAVKKTLDVDVSELPQYWVDNVKSAIAYTMVLGDGYVHHLVTTDNHYDLNYKKSVVIQKILHGTGLYSKVINIGDVGNGSETISAKVLEDYARFGNDLIFALGNHDDNRGEPSRLYPLIENNSHAVGDDKIHFNYYYDDSDHKIRYIVMNTPRGQDTYDYTIEAYNSMPDDYCAIIVSHYPLIAYSFTVDGVEQSASDPTSYGNRLATLELGHKKIACCICGHEHIDHVEDLYNIGIIKQITFMNDGYYWEWVKKEEGTTSENAVTIFSINTTTKDIKIFRIGQTSILPQRYSFKYEEPIDNMFHKNIFIDLHSFIINDPQSFMCLKRKDLYSEDGSLINYYIISLSGAPINTIYEIHYKNGAHIQRWAYLVNTAAVNKYDFTKKRIIWISHGNGINDGATEMIVCFNIESDVDATEDNFIIASQNDDYDLGYAINDLQWVDKIWRANGNGISEYDGYCGTKYISVQEGKTYRLSVEETGWSAQYLSIVGTDRSGAFKAQIYNKRASNEVIFTVPAGVHYIQMCSDNFANYKDKVVLELT